MGIRTVFFIVCRTMWRDRALERLEVEPAPASETSKKYKMVAQSAEIALWRRAGVTKFPKF